MTVTVAVQPDWTRRLCRSRVAQLVNAQILRLESGGYYFYRATGDGLGCQLHIRPTTQQDLDGWEQEALIRKLVRLLPTQPLDKLRRILTVVGESDDRLP